MIPYIILVFCPILIWAIKDKICVKAGELEIYKTKSLSIDAFMLIFLILLAFRGLDCGNDTRQYLRLFERFSSKSVPELFSDDTHEIGYKLLNRLIGVVFGNYQYLLVVTSLLCVCPLWYFYKKESEMPVLTIALFLSVAPFFMYFSGIRQAIAMSIGVFAWYAAKNKKIVRFIILVLVAFLFHASAFVLAAIYPLYYAKITKKWLWFVIPAILVVYFFRASIFNFLIVYLWKDYNMTGETGAFMVFLLLIMFAVYSYIMTNDKEIDQDTIAMRNILLLSVVIQIFAMLHPLSMRMNYYFLIFVPILIPKVAKHCKKQFDIVGKISIVVMTVYFIYYFINTTITGNAPINIFPYVPFWENI